ncbi:MAG: hypothetical protein EOO54_13060 [Haliea sp.]|nr:MAG: hypothetical protein EOO54_13060 [Haliea sp.]
MRKSSIHPRLRPEEFGMFAAVLRDDDGFPRTYGAWLAGSTPGPDGSHVDAVDIGFDEFVAYCRHRCTHPRKVMLDALASSKLAG